MSEEMTLEVTGIDVNVYRTDDGAVLVDKVKFHTPTAPNEQVTMKPRNTEVVEAELAGITTTETNTVRYEPGGFRADYEQIKEAQDALEDGHTVELTATISKFDQSENPDVDGDEVYAYIDQSHENTLELRTENPDSEADAAE